ncbi:MAG: hypothetical protein HOD92_12040 [Deltaproteobacteria bacterium]|nr:hypothetical protein [Deltaproteobacteria bacterium]
MKLKSTCLLLFTLLIISQSAYAEYRAYLLEIYDHIARKKWDAVTGFPPDQYILTHGGGNRLSAFLKATWHCFGDTAGYLQPCPMPAPKNPLFKKGDQVKIALDKHVTEGWIGIVEIILYRSDLRSNIYGVRFGEKRKLYNRYYEFNLEKATAEKQPTASEN